MRGWTGALAMAIMTNQQRFDTWADYMRAPPSGETVSIVKADLRAALDAVDQWVSDNAAAFNAAIPLPARTALSAGQKARLLMFVVQKRFAVGA